MRCRTHKFSNHSHDVNYTEPQDDDSGGDTEEGTGGQSEYSEGDTVDTGYAEDVEPEESPINGTNEPLKTVRRKWTAPMP